MPWMITMQYFFQFGHIMLASFIISIIRQLVMRHVTKLQVYCKNLKTRTYSVFRWFSCLIRVDVIC